MIRKVKAADLIALSEMVGKLQEEAKFADYEIMLLDLMKIIYAAMQDKQYIFLVYEKEETILGFFLGAIRPHLFNTNIMGAWHILWYVKPEQRKTGIGRELWDAFEGSAKASGAQYIYAGCFQDFNNDLMTELFTKRGYIPSEHTFKREVK